MKLGEEPAQEPHRELAGTAQPPDEVPPRCSATPRRRVRARTHVAAHRTLPG